jgi:hypothetical protein
MALAVFCTLYGNYTGDQLTVRDCATKGEAKMMGGGIIQCSVKKATP